MDFCHRPVILSTPDTLKVLGERGLVQLKGKGLGDVHDRLLPHLQQGVAPSALMAALPEAWRGPVSSYFQVLTEAGVLRPDRSELTLDCLLENQDPDDPGVYRDTNGSLRRLCLVGRMDADLIRKYDLAFLVLSKAFLGQVLLRAQELSALGPSVVVMLIDEETGRLAAQIAGYRAFFSQWIRLKTYHFLSADSGRDVRIEEVGAAICRCRLLLHLRPEDRGWPEVMNNKAEWTLYGQLPLIMTTSLGQLPLCSMASNSDVFPFQIRGFGTEPAVLARQVRRRLMLACWLRWPRLVRTSIASLRPDSGKWHAGSCLRDIVPDLVCDWMLETTTPVMSARNLMAADRRDRRLAYLQRLLAIAGHEGVVAYGRTESGLHVFRHGNLVLGAFHERQARYRMLLALVVQAYYGLVPKPAELDSSWRPFVSEDERKRLTRRLLREYGRHCHFGKLTLWGKRLWVGGLRG